MSFRFRNLERMGNSVSVRLQPDAEGFLGRECPVKSCELYFKIKPGTGLKGSELPCICPYCGHKAAHNQFFTKEQIEYAKTMAFRQISDAIGRDLKQMEFRSSPSSFVSMSLTVTHGRRVPIAHYRERALETHLVCPECTLQYAVFGLFAFCPDCGTHNSLDILGANLELVLKQIALALAQDDVALRRHLIEDALENCVSSFDGFGREVVRRAKTDGSGSSVSFQNLERVASKLHQMFAVDLRTAVPDSEWSLAQRSFMKRHLLSHRSGVVDEQYLSETHDPDATMGHRIVVAKEEVEETARILLALGRWLVRQLAPDRE